jgi:predicted anti-sigma-YlaC factor YlaD
MTSYDCETTRDLAPLRIRDDLLPHEATRVDMHLADCAECAAETALVRTLAAAAQAAPAGLDTRVIAAVRRPARRGWLHAGAGMAAAVAAALIGGALLMQSAGPDVAPAAAPGSLVFDDSPAPAVSWVMSDDPLLNGGGLYELSVEQLEFILAELDS